MKRNPMRKTLALALTPLRFNAVHPEAEADALVPNGLSGGLCVEIR